MLADLARSPPALTMKAKAQQAGVVRLARKFGYRGENIMPRSEPMSRVSAGSHLTVVSHGVELLDCSERRRGVEASSWHDIQACQKTMHVPPSTNLKAHSTRHLQKEQFDDPIQ